MDKPKIDYHYYGPKGNNLPMPPPYRQSLRLRMLQALSLHPYLSGAILLVASYAWASAAYMRKSGGS